MRKLLLSFFIISTIISAKSQTVIFQPLLSGDVLSGTDPFTSKSVAAAPADTQIVVNTSQGLTIIHNGHNIGVLKTGLSGVDGTVGVKVTFNFTMDSSKNSNAKAFNIELGNALANTGSPSTASEFAAFSISSLTGTNAKSINISGSSIANQSTPVAVSWYLNNTSNVLSYTGPDGSSNTLASDTWDLWVGNTIALAAQAGTADNAINSFKITANSPGVQTAEFNNITISTFSSTVTPVQLNPLNAIYEKNEVKLNWSTSSEINSKVFKVLRSADGNVFTQIGEDIQAAGNSSSLKTYQAFDDAPLPGTNYYQIKEIDEDGKFTISNIVNINVKSNKLNIWPNPVTDKITIAGATGSIRVYNVSGRLIKTVTAASAETAIDVHALPAGIYIIKANNLSLKFIKR